METNLTVNDPIKSFVKNNSRSTQVFEELGIDISQSCLAPLTFASHAYEHFHLIMPLYVCRTWKGQVTGVEGQALKWLPPNRLNTLPMPPADIPLVAMLMDVL